MLQAEGYRFVPIRIEVGHRRKNSAVIGIPEGATLRGVVDQDLQDVPVPRSGVLMSTRLARELGVSPGDQVRIRVMEGRELERSVTVENTIDEYIAAQLYMRLEAANDLLLEPRLVNAASLRTDSRLNPGLYAALRDMPAVVSVTFRDTALESYEETTAQFTLVISLILMLFASVITVGVVYNNARVALSERDWELSTLRILGFRNSEVFRILIGEIGILLLVAIPIGLGMGYLMAGFLVERTGSVDFELPFVIYPRTFAIATLVLAGAGAFSGYLIARRVRRLDLIETLKSRG